MYLSKEFTTKWKHILLYVLNEGSMRYDDDVDGCNGCPWLYVPPYLLSVLFCSSYAYVYCRYTFVLTVHVWISIMYFMYLHVQYYNTQFDGPYWYFVQELHTYIALVVSTETRPNTSYDVEYIYLYAYIIHRFVFSLHGMMMKVTAVPCHR